jgi:aspartate racemase
MSQAEIDGDAQRRAATIPAPGTPERERGRSVSRPTPASRPIGLISGLGPLAGSDVLDKMLAHCAARYGAVQDDEYPDMVLVSHGIVGLDASGPTSDRLEGELIGMVQDLETHRPIVVGIASNAAHLYLDRLREHTTSPLLNLVDEAAQTAAALPHRYLLLSSSATRRTGLYQDHLARYDVRFVEVSDTQQVALDEVVQMVVERRLDAAGRAITAIVDAVPDEFTAVIAGCTELPIALDHSEVRDRLPIVDANRVLAEALVDCYYGADRAPTISVPASAEPLTR